MPLVPVGRWAEICPRADCSLPVGLPDLPMGLLDLPVGLLDLTMGLLDLTVGLLDLTVDLLDLTVGIFDLPRGRFLAHCPRALMAAQTMHPSVPGFSLHTQVTH